MYLFFIYTLSTIYYVFGFFFFRKNYVPPTLEEGFTEIVKINFIPRFLSEKDQELYEMYLLEN